MTASPFDDAFGEAVLPPELFGHILPYLHPREMLNMVYSCKGMSNYLTYHDIIETACHFRELEPFLQLLGNQAIYMPSKLRLLQLVNGTRCEHCGSSVDVTLDKLGLCYCQKCLQEGHLGLYCAHVNQPQLLNILQTDHRIAISKAKYVIHVLKQSYRTSYGELCGPVVTIDVINDLVATNKSLTNYWEDHINSTLLANQDLIQDLRQIIVRHKMLDRKIVDQRLQTVIARVPMKWRRYLTSTVNYNVPVFRGVARLLDPLLTAPNDDIVETVSKTLVRLFRKLQCHQWPSFGFLDYEDVLQSRLKEHLMRTTSLDDLLCHAPHWPEAALLIQKDDDFGALVWLVFCRHSGIVSPRCLPLELVDWIAVQLGHNAILACALAVYYQGAHVYRNIVVGNRTLLETCKGFYRTCLELHTQQQEQQIDIM